MTILIYVLGSAIGLAVVGYAVLWKLAQTPVRHRKLEPQRIESLLGTLLRYGRPGAILVIHVTGEDPFFQFRILISRNGERKLEAGFPRAPWSENVYERVVALMREQGVSVHRRKVRDTAVSEFALGDFGDNIVLAQQCTSAVLREIFAVVPERDCYALLEGQFD